MGSEQTPLKVNKLKKASKPLSSFFFDERFEHLKESSWTLSLVSSTHLSLESFILE